jgi:hypothetical protein
VFNTKSDGFPADAEFSRTFDSKHSVSCDQLFESVALILPHERPRKQLCGEVPASDENCRLFVTYRHDAGVVKIVFRGPALAIVLGVLNVEVMLGLSSQRFR